MTNSEAAKRHELEKVRAERKRTENGNSQKLVDEETVRTGAPPPKTIKRDPRRRRVRRKDFSQLRVRC